jgi:hypothetical protein
MLSDARTQLPTVGGWIGFVIGFMENRASPQGENAMSPDRIDALSRSLADSTSRRRLLKLLGVGVAGTTATAVGLNIAGGPNAALAATIKNQLTDLPVSGSNGKVHFEGTLDILKFKAVDNKVYAVGRLTGKATKDGGGSQKVAQRVTTRVFVTSSEIQTAAICQVLKLVLGPIDLNLLGLRLQTNRIVITLTANSRGGLLGSLLCGLAGGVDDIGLQAVIDLLNDILAALGGTA